MERTEKINIIKHHMEKIFDEEKNNCANIPEIFIFDRKAFFEDNPLTRLNKEWKLVRDNSLLDKTFKAVGHFDLFKQLDYLHYDGFTSANGKKITILLHEYCLKGNFSEGLYSNILIFFHEFRHIWQAEQYSGRKLLKDTITDFGTFRYLIENDCKKFFSPSYLLKHDDFYFEIDANIYGIEKANDYCSKNNIFAPNLQRSYAERQYSQMINYDFDYFLRLFNIIYRNPGYRLNNKLGSNSTYSIFYNKIGNFRRLSDILNNPLFQGLNDKLKMEILSSNSFLMTVNYQLNNIERSFILEIVDAKIKDLCDSYNKNRHFFENGTFRENTYLQNAYSLFSRMNYLIEFKLRNQESIEKKDKVTQDSEQLKSLLSYFHGKDLFVDSNNLRNPSDLSFTIKMIQEAILQKIDINTSPLDAEYEPVIEENRVIKK